MRLLPFTARPRLMTGRMMLEPGLLLFLVLDLIGLHGQTLNVTVVIADFVIGAPAIVYPLWLWSRRLTVTSDGVEYSALFRRAIRIPYQEVRTVAIDGKRMMEVGSLYTYYFLRITGAHGQLIQVTMDNYREADLRAVAQEIITHAEKARLKGLGKALLVGSYSFAKARVS